MIWDWIFRLLYWRSIREDIREMNEMVAGWGCMQAQLDAKMAQLYTPTEFEALRQRCERQLTEFGH